MAKQAGLVALCGAAVVVTGIACSSPDSPCTMVLTGAVTGTQVCELAATSEAESYILIGVGSRDSGTGSGADYASLYVVTEGELSPGPVNSHTSTFRASVERGGGAGAQTSFRSRPTVGRPR